MITYFLKIIFISLMHPYLSFFKFLKSKSVVGIKFHPSRSQGERVDYHLLSATIITKALLSKTNLV